MRKLVICAAVLTAAIAVAATTIVGAKGTGGAVNAAGIKWGYAMDVKKVTVDGETRVGGFFRVRREFRDGNSNFLVEIGMPNAGRFEAGNTGRATFTGRAKRIVKRDGVVIREDHGPIAVSVADRRETGASGEPDLLSFNYRPDGRTSNEGVSFSGRVYWGDIDVYSRTE
jgi:hypothetical protein